MYVHSANQPLSFLGNSDNRSVENIGLELTTNKEYTIENALSDLSKLKGTEFSKHQKERVLSQLQTAIDCNNPNKEALAKFGYCLCKFFQSTTRDSKAYLNEMQEFQKSFDPQKIPTAKALLGQAGLLPTIGEDVAVKILTPPPPKAEKSLLGKLSASIGKGLSALKENATALFLNRLHLGPKSSPVKEAKQASVVEQCVSLNSNQKATLDSIMTPEMRKSIPIPTKERLGKEVEINHVRYEIWKKEISPGETILFMQPIASLYSQEPDPASRTEGQISINLSTQNVWIDGRPTTATDASTIQERLGLLNQGLGQLQKKDEPKPPYDVSKDIRTLKTILTNVMQVIGKGGGDYSARSVIKLNKDTSMEVWQGNSPSGNPILFMKLDPPKTGQISINLFTQEVWVDGHPPTPQDSPKIEERFSLLQQGLKQLNFIIDARKLTEKLPKSQEFTSGNIKIRTGQFGRSIFIQDGSSRLKKIDFSINEIQMQDATEVWMPTQITDGEMALYTQILQKASEHSG